MTDVCQSTQTVVKVGMFVRSFRSEPIIGLTLDSFNYRFLIKPNSVVSLSGHSFVDLSGAPGFYNIILNEDDTQYTGHAILVFHDRSLLSSVIEELNIITPEAWQVKYGPPSPPFQCNFSSSPKVV